MLRKILLLCCLVVLSLGTVVGCSPAPGREAPPGATTP